MAKVYGYARVSTAKQNVERQLENIKAFNPDAEIYSESFTGTKLDRPQFTKLLNRVKAGDTIIFDEISRMARCAQEGFELYQKLYNDGIELVFLKEPALNSSTYKHALSNRLDIPTISTGRESVDKLSNGMIRLLNDFMMDLAREQIYAAFGAAQHEVDFLHKRTRDGMRAAHAGEKIAEARTGRTFESKKSVEVKAKIRKLSKDFEGQLSDAEILSCGYIAVARNSYYKYKSQLRAEDEAQKA